MFDFNKSNESYTEILRLDRMLNDAQIPHTLKRFMDGWQILYYHNGELIADAIQHFGSYGKDQNLLEIMGLLTPEEKAYDSVLGYLTAEDVFSRIKKHYTEANTSDYATALRAYEKQEQ